MNIGIDMMGGDFAPAEAVKGVRLFLSGSSAPATLFLFGDEKQVADLVRSEGIPANRITIVPTTQVIEMHEHPTRALKEKQQSSISVGFQYLATGKIDAFISAGNTGAMLVGTMYSIKAIEGVQLPLFLCSTIFLRSHVRGGEREFHRWWNLC